MNVRSYHPRILYGYCGLPAASPPGYEPCWESAPKVRRSAVQGAAILFLYSPLLSCTLLMRGFASCTYLPEAGSQARVVGRPRRQYSAAQLTLLLLGNTSHRPFKNLDFAAALAVLRFARAAHLWAGQGLRSGFNNHARLTAGPVSCDSLSIWSNAAGLCGL
jgi:hypothetical protein